MPGTAIINYGKASAANKAAKVTTAAAAGSVTVTIQFPNFKDAGPALFDPDAGFEPTIVNCAVVNAADDTLCDMAVDGYTLAADKKSAATSVAGCKFADERDGSLCTTCATAFAKSTDGRTCVGQVVLCKTHYAANGAACATCQTAYSLSADKAKCTVTNSIPSCAVHSPTDGGVCLTCARGFIAPAGGASCAVARKIAMCSAYNPASGLQCTACSSKYTLTPDKTSCVGSVLGCSAHSAADGTKCDACAKGYVLSAGKDKCSAPVVPPPPPPPPPAVTLVKVAFASKITVPAAVLKAGSKSRAAFTTGFIAELITKPELEPLGLKADRVTINSIVKRQRRLLDNVAVTVNYSIDVPASIKSRVDTAKATIETIGATVGTSVTQGKSFQAAVQPDSPPPPPPPPVDGPDSASSATAAAPFALALCLVAAANLAAN